MYTAHPDFEAPADNDILWRYFDLARYLDLLIREQVFFASIDRMEDPFEGWGTDPGFRRKAGPLGLFTVSSWHSSEEENYAMWKIYAQGTAGLAVQTRFGRLRDAFGKTDKPVWIGKVHYYKDAADASGDSELKPFLRKRSVYAFEKEVRCCYQARENEIDRNRELSGEFTGVYISVDLKQLIERIYVSPYAPDWFKQLIAGIHQKFGIDKPIIHSDMLGQ